MPRFYIPPDSWNLDRLGLDGDEAHHCLHVLRLQTGDRVTVFNGQGVEAVAEIAATGKDSVALKRIQHSKSPALDCHLTLAQAVPKGKNMELIIEKATELGASAIAPLLSERTVVQVDADDAAKKRDKWQRTAIEAAKQCGQNWLPTVQLPRSIKAFFESGEKYDLALIASLQPDALPLKAVLKEAVEALPAELAAQGVAGLIESSRAAGRPFRVLILVGPEGDFTPAEISLAKSYGCRPITLGPIILRTETAAIYCLSVIGHELFI